MSARIDTSDPLLQTVLAALGARGNRAFVVGGAVRNALMGLAVADWDIATDALPDETAALAVAAGLKPVPTGIDHGTVTIVASGTPFEVTTLRRDVATDGRRATVAYSRDIAEDAQRRDFTMNALYAKADGTVVDPVGGLADLAARRLRFVGNARDRIREDYLRILRLFRFLAWYGNEKSVDAATLAACAELAPGLARISHERIGAEMRKLLAAPDPSQALALMTRAGVLPLALPGADASHLPALIKAERAAGVPPEWPRRLAGLGASDAPDALRLSKHEAREQHRIAAALSLPLAESAYRHGAQAARDAALIRIAAGEALPDWQGQIARAANQRFPLRAADLAPWFSGPALGQALRSAEQHWIESGFTLGAQALINAARNAPTATDTPADMDEMNGPN